MTNTQDIQNKAAETDMRRVRKSTAMAITDTAKGIVELTYEHATKTYTLAMFHGGQVLATGSAKQVKPVLASLYVVVMA